MLEVLYWVREFVRSPLRETPVKRRDVVRRPAPSYDIDDQRREAWLKRHLHAGRVVGLIRPGLLRVNPEDPTDVSRDRFLLSKGHGPMAYYAVLAAKGFIPTDVLKSFGEYDSILGQHPDRTLIPGVEIASGSLGHGLPIALGMSAALDLKDADGPRVFCLIGNAEFEEDSNHEAVVLAGRMGISRLAVCVIDNGSAT